MSRAKLLVLKSFTVSLGWLLLHSPLSIVRLFSRPASRLSDTDTLGADRAELISQMRAEVLLIVRKATGKGLE